ncbi:MAG: hypothetical protein HGA42_20975 [Nostocales cyanobacterium W4_Combined_metabat2_030]|nr:hypothetical protein [Nostocales cyanobacterium W4_Combined_metabat2_030]
MKKLIAFLLATITSTILIPTPIKADENIKTTTHQSPANWQISATPAAEISTL